MEREITVIEIEGKGDGILARLHRQVIHTRGKGTATMDLDRSHLDLILPDVVQILSRTLVPVLALDRVLVHLLSNLSILRLVNLVLRRLHDSLRKLKGRRLHLLNPKEKLSIQNTKMSFL